MAPTNGDRIEVGGELPRLTAGSFLADIANRHGDREALTFEGRSISYRALEAAVSRLARALLGAGVVKGARVAVQLSNRPEWVETFFAVSQIGAVFVPISTFATREERDYVLRHSDASVLILQPSLLNHAYLDELLADIQYRSRLARLVEPGTSEEVRSILAEVDLSGAPQFAMPLLLRIGLDAVRHVVSQSISAVELLVDPAVTSTVWEIPLVQDRPAEGSQK